MQNRETTTSKKERESNTRGRPPTAIGDFNDAVEIAIRLKSCSRKNYAKNLSIQLFSFNERCGSNVSGTCGKEKLDEGRIELIKRSTFRMFPLESTEKECQVWQACVKAIDCANRTLILKAKEGEHVMLVDCGLCTGIS